jgi:DNA-binding Xre family transcriptional regulator
MATEIASWATSGIYAITNTKTGECYVGSATLCAVRWGIHLRQLKTHKHPSKSLQAAWDRDGAEAFAFEILETVTDEYALGTREQAWLESLQPKYNTILHSNRARGPRQPQIPWAEKLRGRTLPYLRAWRMHKLMAQIELAERSGLAKSTLARAERGDEVVSFANIRKLAEALGISAEDLLNRAPEGG